MATTQKNRLARASTWRPPSKIFFNSATRLGPLYVKSPCHIVGCLCRGECLLLTTMSHNIVLGNLRILPENPSADPHFGVRAFWEGRMSGHANISFSRTGMVVKKSATKSLTFGSPSPEGRRPDCLTTSSKLPASPINLFSRAADDAQALSLLIDRLSPPT